MSSPTWNSNARWATATPTSDVVAIELKHGSKKKTPEQEAYLVRLRGCNVATLVSNDYDEFIIFLHEQGIQEEAHATPGDSQRAHSNQFRAARQHRLLVQQATDQGEHPQDVRAARHEPRGSVEAPEQADSQRVDLTRQDYGGNASLATLLALLAPLENLVDLSHDLAGQRRQVEEDAVLVPRVLYLVPD